MANGVELTEKELKDVVGGAYIKDGYVYFYSEGKNWRAKILRYEDTVKGIIDSFTEQGLSNEEVAQRLFPLAYNNNYLAYPEEC